MMVLEFLNEPMKTSVSPGRMFVDLDPSAFLADPELIRALETRATAVPCDADNILFKQDDPPVGVYIIRQGQGSLSMKSPEGRSILSVQALPGSLLGLPGVIGNQPYSLTAAVRAGAQVSFVSSADFFALMQSQPQLSLKMLQVLAAEVRTARRALY
jgi:CRP-like cAMP-binding protein